MKINFASINKTNLKKINLVKINSTKINMSRNVLTTEVLDRLIERLISIVPIEILATIFEFYFYPTVAVSDSYYPINNCMGDIKTQKEFKNTIYRFKEVPNVFYFAKFIVEQASDTPLNHLMEEHCHQYIPLLNNALELKRLNEKTDLKWIFKNFTNSKLKIECCDDYESECLIDNMGTNKQVLDFFIQKVTGLSFFDDTEFQTIEKFANLDTVKLYYCPNDFGPMKNRVWKKLVICDSHNDGWDDSKIQKFNQLKIKKCSFSVNDVLLKKYVDSSIEWKIPTKVAIYGELSIESAKVISRFTALKKLKIQNITKEIAQELSKIESLEELSIVDELPIGSEGVKILFGIRGLKYFRFVAVQPFNCYRDIQSLEPYITQSNLERVDIHGLSSYTKEFIFYGNTQLNILPRCFVKYKHL